MSTVRPALHRWLTASGVCLGALNAGCGPPVPVVAVTPARMVHTPVRARCPQTPLLEWHTLDTADALPDAGATVGAPFGVAGHVRTITVEDDPPALVGVLDPKGALAMARHTGQLAQGTWRTRGTQPDAPARQLAVVLEGTVIARADVVTTLRGPRFRVLLDPTARALPMGERLQAAADQDRPCFAALAPAD